MLTLKDLRKDAIERLLASPFLCKNSPYTRKEAMLDVDVLLGYLLKKTRAYILAHLEADASAIQAEFELLLYRRVQGVSIAYLIEEKEFYGLTFYVNPSVLIPKADTETLVDVALEVVSALFEKKNCSSKEGHLLKDVQPPREVQLRILDVFSGSGCVGIATVHSLLKNFENLEQIIRCSFLDISLRAIEVSRLNACKLLPSSIQTHLSFVCQDARSAFPLANGEYDCILANPPYIPQEEVQELLSDGRAEPELALLGGKDGFAFFEILAINSLNALSNEGVLLCEVGDGQSELVSCIFAKAGFVNLACYNDYSQKKRVVKGEKRKE